jgi:tetratricopeptide (TPR) repeat protein
MAINAALQNDWTQAINLNTKIVKEDKRNINALNRLAFAYFQIGEIKKAESCYRQVMNLDPYNEITKKNLVRLGNLKGKNRSKKINEDLSGRRASGLFIEEPGKTKCITLFRVTTPQILSSLRPGGEVKLMPKKHTVIVIGGDNTYLGALPDDVGHRLAKRIKAGNKYEAYIKLVDKKNLVVFVREIYQTKRYYNQQAFPTPKKQDYYTFVRDKTTITQANEEGSEEEEESPAEES